MQNTAGASAPEQTAKASHLGTIGAVLFGAAGLASFTASLIYKWKTTTTDLGSMASMFEGMLGSDPNSMSKGTVITANTTVSSGLGQIYVIGVIALVGLLGLAFRRPTRARSVRAAAVGVGLALSAVVAAIMLDSAGGPEANPALAGLTLLGAKVTAATHTTYELGLWFGFGAVVATVLATWFAGGQAKARPAVEAPGVVGEAGAPAA